MSRFIEFNCSPEVEAEWDNINWRLNISADKSTSCTLKFESKEYEEEILAGSYPVVKDELVPVTISDDGTVAKADLNTIWYDYENSVWANAVILTGDDTYKAGDIIPEESIESYFVWIPKYRYKLFNVDTATIDPQEIEIEFGNYDTVNSDTECVATNESGNNGTCTNGKWMTHPAFTSLGVNGIWVGKFETGYKGSTNASSAEKNENSPEKVEIKPNVNSWRSINISNAYNTSYSYKRSLDSHMMKNTEWGALSYLTNSKYGRGNSEVLINNNNNYVTGCAGSSVLAGLYNGCENAWNTNLGYHASTTDNISGIYDTSGGAWGLMMAVYNNTVSQSGLNPSSIENKYIDRYTGTDINAKILGDATGETKGWNGDASFFVSSGLPWFYRGGAYHHGSSAGVFSFSYNDGSAYSSHGFRLVLD